MITAGKRDIDLRGDALPVLRTAVPGPESVAWLQRLEATECPGSTVRRFSRGTRRPTILWSEALGSNVADVDGNIYVDLCAGFGVASIGHRHPAVVAAGKAQLDRLPHAMGDAFADVRRVMLMEALSRLTGLPRVMLVTSGSEAVEVAMKTAVLATGRHKIVAFRGAYHGLSIAPLTALGHQVEQRQAPFRAMLGGAVTLSSFGGALPDLSDVAAVLVEPVQGRGGMRAPPPGWLAGLHAAAHAAGALVIHDEIYCGLGRTGTLFAGSAELDSAGKPLSPDLLCVGKALGGGFPISACLGNDAAMATWSSNPGALHTQTFLGNPIGCAMALASLEVIASEGLTSRAADLGRSWARALEGVRGVRGVTGRGLMLGVVVDDAPGVTARMLQRGWLVLPCGEHNEAIGLTPPLTISQALIDGAVAVLAECIECIG